MGSGKSEKREEIQKKRERHAHEYKTI